MRSPVESIQEAISARFTTEFSGKPLSGKVYNYVPKGTALPYLFIESWELSPNTEVKGSNGSPFAVVGTLHVYSNTTGSQECEQLTEDVIEAVTTANFDLSGDNFSNFMTSMVSVGVVPESDSIEVRWHGTIKFQWRVQDTS